MRTGTNVALRRNKSWTGIVVRRAGDMILVAWLTGPLAGESKWTEPDAVRDNDDQSNEASAEWRRDFRRRFCQIRHRSDCTCATDLTSVAA